MSPSTNACGGSNARTHHRSPTRSWRCRKTTASFRATPCGYATSSSDVPDRCRHAASDYKNSCSIAGRLAEGVTAEWPQGLPRCNGGLRDANPPYGLEEPGVARLLEGEEPRCVRRMVRDGASRLLTMRFCKLRPLGSAALILSKAETL